MVYKFTDTKGITKVIISSTANSAIQVEIGEVNKVTSRRLNKCGFMVLRPPNSGDWSGLKVDGKNINVSTLAVNRKPSCKKSFPAVNNQWKTVNNEVVIAKTSAAFQSILVTMPGTSLKTLKINQCGFGTLSPQKGGRLPATFKINSTTYILANLKDSGSPPVQKTTKGVVSCYKPNNWE